ncbi:phospholipase D family protein [Roseibium album]|uniref:phospholipase D family protein n=1 Tax=Roseibium album TaxID=311410 RepID=UPI003BB10023
MILHGERVKELVATAQNEVLLCAPFIKAQALQVVLSAIQSSVHVRVVTRWRPEEVAAGVSDLEVFEIIGDRAHAKLELLDDLHAKIILADERCLIGSANITAAALGWSKKPNVEFLTELGIRNNDVQSLLERLNSAQPATFRLKSEIAELAKALAIPKVLDEGKISEEELEAAANPWLPKCAAPEHLFEVYTNENANIVVAGTRENALEDLRDISPPPNLSEEDFRTFVATSIAEFPAVVRFLERVSSKLTDHDAIEVMREIRPTWEERDLSKQWEIVRDWIRIFFADKFEVAPESFVVRMKKK